MPNALIILAPGFEEVEAITIIDLLRRATIDVTVAGLVQDYVEGSHKITIKTDEYYKNVDPENFDILILPGGQPGTNNLKADKTILEWIRKRHQSGKKLAAICAAPTVMYAAGILKGIKVTSFPSEEKVFDPENYLHDNVVVDGNIITSRGVGTAIEFSLALVSILREPETAEDLRKRIVYKLDQ